MAKENPSDVFLDKNLQKDTYTFKHHVNAKHNTVGTRMAESELQEGKRGRCVHVKGCTLHPLSGGNVDVIKII